MSNETTKRIPAIAAAIEGYVLTFTGDNGRVLTIDAQTLSREVWDTAVMHGLKQKIGDAAAISRNPETGRSATTDDKFDAMSEVFNRLMAGHWNKPRESGDGAAGGLLFKALCRVKADKTPAEVRAYLDGRTKEEQAALRKVPVIAAAIDALRAESAKAAGIDGEALLADF
jgi:frataxin-like iron-binding protein CyaY